MKQLDGGIIKIFGEEVSYKKPTKFPHFIGYMPQETALIPELTIKETLNFFGNIYQMNSTLLRQRLTMISDLLDLNVNKRVEQLSGGGKSRVSFAAALIHNPQILILDEPTVGLDCILREKIWTFLIDSTKSSNMSVIITTHYIAEAERSNCCGLMINGMLLAEDHPQDILAKYGVQNLEEAFLSLCMSRKSKTVDYNFNDIPKSTSSLNIANPTYANVPSNQVSIGENKDIEINKRKKFSGQAFKALFTKESIRLRRQPG